MRVLSVVGARPQFIKLAPVSEALERAGTDHIIVHTGQHYEAAMSDAFFEDLRIPTPDVALGIGSGSHGAQTGAMLVALEPFLEDISPDWVLVYGDTNSTIAGALAAVKLHLPVAHLEAGLRSFNRLMPEEHNRVLADHAADLLLAPTAVAIRNLESEGLSDRAVLVGDVMVDVCLRVARVVAGRSVSDLSTALTPGGYVAATLHRAENTDRPTRLTAVIAALQKLSVPVVLPVHPRLRDRAAAAGIQLMQGSLIPISPLSYPAMLRLVLNARSVVTDSGGLQKECYVLGVPCTTLRTETEWVETLTDGWNVINSDIRRLEDQILRPVPNLVREPFFGDGNASEAVVRTLGEAGNHKELDDS